MSDSRTSPSPDTPSESVRFGFSAILRIMCASDRHDNIEDVTGLTPTHKHRAGDEGLFGEPWPNDLWTLESMLPPAAPLDDHLDWLWNEVRPHRDYLRDLAVQDDVDMDVFCGYRSNCAECGFELAPTSLQIVEALDVPLQVSVVFR